ncbi:hypothetical protein NE237_017515 [Protea cynaroides]|uniref:Uncharacterized protein n=1 Tax=Protea cynaroides TaxID=273540 RepID=A0A9Q0K851_9MAGN|nr:hypothetical protein NE237_017515 [Protea cynaroides]
MQSLCFAAATSGGEREGESEMKGAAAVERRGYNNRCKCITSALPKHLGKNVLYCLRRSTWHSRKITSTPKTPQQDPTSLPEKITSAAPEHLNQTHLPKTMARLHTLFPKKIISIPVNTSARMHYVALEDDISITQNSSTRPKSLAQEDHLGTLAKPFSKATMERMITEEPIKLDLMENKALLRFLILFLGFSYLKLISFCFHLLNNNNLCFTPYRNVGDEDPSVQEFVDQGLIEGINQEEGLELEETTVRARRATEIIDDYKTLPPPHSRARMDIENIKDYGEIGPNDSHHIGETGPNDGHHIGGPPHSRARMDIESIEDYGETGPNDGHHIGGPPHSRARMHIESIEDHGETSPNDSPHIVGHLPSVRARMDIESIDHSRPHDHNHHPPLGRN